MKSRTVISILVASVLAFSSMSSFAQQGQRGGGSADRAQQVDRADRNFDREGIADRDRLMEQERTQARERVRDPANLQDRDIYGNEFMNPDECDQYRQQLGSANTQEARQEFQAQHESKMQQRALQQGQDLVPPGQGPIYGGEFMSVQERNQFRQQLHLSDSDAERQELQTRQREQMRERAHALNLDIEEVE